MSIAAPKIQNLEEGLLKCSSCSADIPLKSAAPLEVINCPKCTCQVLIPMKVKNYWLYSPLGGGGMGSVYKAFSASGEGREYAVKVLPRMEKANPDFIKALLHEGEIGASLGTHPNIISTVDYGVDGDEHFLVSEFIDGDRLDLLIGEKNHIPEKRAVEITLQILEAEMHILKCGYLFRDLKPQNIIIDKNGTARLFDYGLCATLDEAAEANLADEVQGSPFYIPPERIVGAPEGEFSEIYSLGMILFYMLAGRTYYSLAEINDLVSKHISSLRVLSVETYLKSSDPKTISVLDKMIARTPTKRYSDFISLKQDMVQLHSQLRDPKATLSPIISKALKSSFGKKAFGRKARITGIVLGAIVILACLGAFATWGYSAHQKKVRFEKLRKEITESVASELGVPPDIKAPSLTPDMIAAKIDEAVKEAIAKKTADMKPFNEQETRKAISKTLNINPDDKPSATLDQVKKKMQEEIKAAAENEIKKIDRSFNEEAEIRKIAAEMKVPLPLKEPSASLKDVDAEFKEYLQKKVDEKYSPRMYSSKIMEIDRKYSGYKKGDNVEVVDSTGIPFKGVYRDRVGNKIFIGDRQILVSDLPANERWKFNESDSEAMLQKMANEFKDEFKRNKEKYRKEIEAAEKPELYKKYGYFASSDGTYKNPREIIDERIKKLKAARQDDIRKKEKAIRDGAEGKFDKSGYMRKNHFREVDGVWHPESEVVDVMLAKEKESFENRRKALLDSIRENAFKDAEKQVYTSNGYVFRENKWQPARKLLDGMVEKKIKEQVK